MTRTKISWATMGTVLLLASSPAYAQLAPTPQKAPRTPVSKELLSGKASPAVTPSQLLNGQATVLDAGRISIQGVELRLFGVVPPLLGASFGPQARAVIDNLAAGPVTCQVKDREKSGSYLATCRTANNTDFALELLRRGLAATARGSLATSDYASTYIATERAAQDQKLGIWSHAAPEGVTDKNVRESLENAKAERLAAEKELAEAKQIKAVAEAAKAEAMRALGAAQESKQTQGTEPQTTTTATSGQSATATVVNLGNAPTADLSSTEIPSTALAGEENFSSAEQQTPSLLPPLVIEPASFVEKYQILTTGIIAIIASLCVTGVVFLYKVRQRKDELRSIAAALRGELMAARSVCQARLAKSAHDGHDRATSWPRIRVIVFQAYVAQLGRLGADLSRQIASIYGMASDYATYYGSSRSENTPKRGALETLIQHIDEVLPRLAAIEQSGSIPAPIKMVAVRSALPSPNKVLSLGSSKMAATPSSHDTPPKGPAKTESRPMPAPKERSVPSAVEISMAQAKSEIVTDTTKARASASPVKTMKPKQAPVNESKAAPKLATSRPRLMAKPAEKVASTKPTERVSPLAAKFVSQVSDVRETLATKGSAKIQEAAQTALRSVSAINFKAPIFERLAKLKKLSAIQPTTPEMESFTSPEHTDFTIPDYANLTEEELEALLYAEEEMLMASPAGKSYGR